MPRLAIALVALSLYAPAAHATPPEGCVGFPDIPQAFVCVTQWTPDHAVPSVSQGPDQTVVIPEFCVFQCFGPTPVNVPSVVVTQGDGVIAKITYNGSTYTVAVPPAGDPNQLVQQAVQTITGAVTTVLGLVGTAEQAAPAPLSLTLNYNCLGCGSTNGSGFGTFTGINRGSVYVLSQVNVAFSADASAGCLTTTASGNIAGAINGSFTLESIGDTALLTLSGDLNGGAFGAFLVSTPISGGCGGPASIALKAVTFGV